jgi:hypothetical protein
MRRLQARENSVLAFRTVSDERSAKAIALPLEARTKIKPLSN